MPLPRLRTLGLLIGLLAARVAWTDEAPKSAVEHGRLTSIDGLPVLELWGTRTEMAYAHGYLQAREIVRNFDEFILTDAILPDLALYGSVVLPSQRVRWEWDGVEAELAAMLEGMKARLGPGKVWSKRLERELAVDDLMAANTVPDWNGLFCSSFSVWGAMSADGNTLTARNLDYDFTPSMVNAQIIMIQHGAPATADTPARKPWIAVTWPGLLGVFTGVNGDNVGVFSHDSNSLPKSHASGFTPRGIIYRETLEQASGSNAMGDVARILRSRRVICGNNLHVCAPRRGDEQPACVFEYDANAEAGGVTERLDDATANVLDGTAKKAADGPAIADAKRVPLTAPPVVGSLVCTNHMRSRKPTNNKCHRYARLMKGLHEAAEAKKPLDVAAAFELISGAAGKTTLHTVVLEANAGRLHVRIPALKPAPVTIDYLKWFETAGAGR
ncbi:MAG: hypothetical protein SF069_12745 [Phycisphaerae bacterium]|nr:hypothetical protein [Phycisphaerae bacterium]